mmetsp:Transcript_113144/g.283202  ORF Transcript_113144/g.283202 Transcript_113144/m.283202 type:complete len:206 (-) Transcript_113144:23-640(-)
MAATHAAAGAAATFSHVIAPLAARCKRNHWPAEAPSGIMIRTGAPKAVASRRPPGGTEPLTRSSAIWLSSTCRLPFADLARDSTGSATHCSTFWKRAALSCGGSCSSASSGAAAPGALSLQLPLSADAATPAAASAPAATSAMGTSCNCSCCFCCCCCCCWSCSCAGGIWFLVKESRGVGKAEELQVEDRPAVDCMPRASVGRND